MNATRAQVGKLMGTFAALGIVDRARRLEVLRALVYRPITSSNDLSSSEASWSIEILASAMDRDDPGAYIDGLVTLAAKRVPALYDQAPA